MVVGIQVHMPAAQHGDALAVSLRPGAAEEVREFQRGHRGGPGVADPEREAVRLAEVLEHRRRHDRDQVLGGVRASGEQSLQLGVELVFRIGIGDRLDVLDERERLVGLLFSADTRALPDVRDERSRARRRTASAGRQSLPR